VGESCDSIKGNAFGHGPVEEENHHVFRQRPPMRYVSLHHHSTFSYLDGYQMPEAHVRRATELNMGALALTEHGNVSSWSKLEQSALREGIKPIYGCELYTGLVGERATQRKNHLTVLAENQTGHRNILEIVSQAFQDFYYEPTTGWDNLQAHRDGLVVLSGCTGSLLQTSLMGGKNIDPADASYERGKGVAQRFKRLYGDSYYLEVQAFPQLENICRVNPMLAAIGDELDIPLVATGDVHYTTLRENEMQQILHNVRGGNKQTLEEQARAWGYDVPLCPPLSDKAMVARLRSTGLSRRQAVEAVLSTEEIAQRCNVTLPHLPFLRYPCEDPVQVFKDWLREGWAYRKCDRLNRSEQSRYRRQLTYEMSIIQEKDYVDYFLVVSDIVKFAKNSGIPVGPARGSAAASIVCWLLRITEVNPMVFPGLVFERFIDLTRSDLPDIDLDFDSDRRSEIWEYARRKYGEACVGSIGTFTFYKSKNSLDDVARVYRIPVYEVERVKELLLERSSGDLRASATIEDTVEQFEAAAAVVEKYPELRKAMDLEGNVKGMGVHAAGLVVANGPLTEICATYERKVKDERVSVISLDKEDAEKYGVLKIDILGLNTMSMIAECLRMLDMPLEALYDIPLDDPDVIAAFQRNDVVGVFQFDGRAMRSVNAELQPDSFKEVCDVNALARPGPLHNNASAEYVDIKWGRKRPQRIHPLYDRIAEQTHYQIIYQEQILRIVREIGGFDWTHASYIRKIISKKIGEQEFNRQWGKFWEGAKERGLEEEQARRIWGMCITAGSYAFNVAHCVSYGMLAWWTMWLKVHHPIEFYVASLMKMPEDKQLNYLRDAHRHGITAEPPDPNASGLSWSAVDGRLLGGLIQIPGIGPKLAPAMVNFREEQPYGVRGWNHYQELRGVGEKKTAAWQTFCDGDDPYGVHWLQRRLDSIRESIEGGELGALPVPTHTSLEIPYSRGNDEAVVWLGMIRHRNLRDLFESNFARTGVELKPEEVKDPHLNEWVIAIGEDEDELVTITWDRWKYPHCKRGIWGIKLNSDVVLIQGVKKGWQARRAVYVTRFWVIDPDT